MVLYFLKKWVYFIISLSFFSSSFLIALVCPVLRLYNEKYSILFVTIFSHVIWGLYSLIFNITTEIRMDVDQLDKVKDYENVIIMSNHIGASDYMVLHEIAKKKKMLKNCKYILKQSLFFMPFIGWSVYFMKFCFISRIYEEDKKRIKKWCETLKNKLIPIWIVFYPEGSRFNQKKHMASVEFCKKQNIQPYKNLLAPRVKGFSIIHEHLKDYTTKIVDITMKYFDENGNITNTPDLLTFFCLRPKGYYKVSVRVYETKEISDPKKFLFDLYRIKDENIQKWLSE